MADKKEVVTKAKDKPVDTDVVQVNPLDNPVETFGDEESFVLLCEASSKKENWIKTTRIMTIVGVGVVLSVTTRQGENISEALQFIPGVKLLEVNPSKRMLVRM